MEWGIATGAVLAGYGVYKTYEYVTTPNTRLPETTEYLQTDDDFDNLNYSEELETEYESNQIQKADRRIKCMSNKTLKQLNADLQPNAQENNYTKLILDFICNKIKECLRPSKIIKSGSFGRGTHLHGKFDIDIVVVLNHNNFLQELEKININYQKTKKRWIQHKFIIESKKKLTKSLKNIEFEVEYTTTHMITGKYKDINFDIMCVPHIEKCDDILYFLKKHNLYDQEVGRMLSAALKPTSLTKYQMASPRAKSLIRVIKFWRDNIDWEEEENQKQATPISFTLETIMLHVYDEKKKDFKIIKDFFEELIKSCDGSEYLDHETGLQLDPLREMSYAYLLKEKAQIALDEFNTLYKDI